MTAKARVTLTPEQGHECARLYVAGSTLAEIARVMPVEAEAIRRVLMRARIQLRKRGPRPGRAATPKGTSR